MAAALGHQDVVFDSNTDSAPLGINIVVVLRHVDPRLNGEDHSGLKRPPLSVDPIFANIVNIKTQPVTGTMHIEVGVRARVNQLLNITRQKT